MWARAAIVGLIWGLIWSTAVIAQDNKSVEPWLAGGPRADIRWTTHASPASLSRFERLTARFSIRADGREIERRRGKGALMMMVELQDSGGKHYELDRTIDLREAPYASASHVAFSEWIVSAFLTPGDYQVTFAMADVTSGEHNLARQKLHVAPLRNDPLPDAWRDIPPVEFIESAQPPDSWVVPESKAQLALPLAARRPVRVDILMNTAVSETSRGVQRHPEQSIGTLVSALKVLSQLDVHDGSLNIALFDVTRRRPVFAQDAVTGLDWPRLRTALTTDNLNTIDVGSLKDRDQDAQFFLHQIAGRIAAPTTNSAVRVVIVLSPPMAFPQGVDRTPIQPPANPDFRLFYIRYQTFAGPPGPIPSIGATRPSFADSVGRPQIDLPRHGGSTYPGLPDQLAQTVKPLHPHLFDIFTPLDFRNAIAAILREVSSIN